MRESSPGCIPAGDFYAAKTCHVNVKAFVRDFDDSADPAWFGISGGVRNNQAVAMTLTSHINANELAERV